MDIHRCRFIPYPAASINSLAFSHNLKPEQKTPGSLRLALGRANGDIEIWNPAKGIWSQETVFRGGKDRSIEGLAWTQDLDEESESTTTPGQLRLFSIGYSSSVTEWNLSTGMPLRHASGNHAEVWSLAVQPRWRKDDGLSSRSNQLLAVGCADGSIVLHSTADDDLTLVKVLRGITNRKARILSLSFCDRNTLAAGCSDGTVLVYDIRGRGKLKSTMHIGTGPSKTSAYVWIVKYLSGNVLVSGESTGELKFWDLQTFTVTQRLLCHDGDVLTLASNADGTLFYSGGMDRKVCLIAKDKSTQRWREIYHQKIHSGQVKAMASIETKDLSVVVSGGISPSPAVLPLRASGRENFRTLPGLPQSPPLISAAEDRLIFSWWNREVAFCELNNELLHWMSVQNTTNRTNEAESLQRLLVQGEENISSVSVSRSGRLLAIATNTTCKIFVLSKRSNGTSTRKIRRLDSEDLARRGAKHVEFSPDGQWLLLVQPDNGLCLYQISIDDNSNTGFQVERNSISLQRSDRASSQPDALRQYRRTISKVAWSEDSKMIISGDIEGNLDAWLHDGPSSQAIQIQESNATGTNGYTNGVTHSADTSDESEDEEDEDSSANDSGPWRRIPHRLPRLPSSPLLLTFRPLGNSQTQASDTAGDDGSDDRLVVITLDHEILEFHTRTGRLTDWSKRNLSSQLPPQFHQVKDRVMGSVWDKSNNGQRLWLYGSTFLFMFDMSKDFTFESATSIRPSHRKLKRRRSFRSDGRDGHSKRTSGAGGRTTHPNEFGLAISSNVRERSKILDAHDEDSEDDDDDDDDAWTGFAPNYNSTLKRQTDQEGGVEQRNTNHNRDAGDAEDAQDTEEQEVRPADLIESKDRTVRKQVSWWHTYKYRPILGLVPLGQTGKEKDIASDDEQDESMTTELEVALVERALWNLDLDLPYL